MRSRPKEPISPQARATNDSSSARRSRRKLGIALAILGAAALLAGCNDFVVDQHAVYTNTSTQTVTGAVPIKNGDPLAGVTVNGIDASVNGSRFEATITLDGAAIFNPVLVVARYASGEMVSQRSTIVYGDGQRGSIQAGGAPNRAGLTARLTSSALTKLAPAIAAATLIPVEWFALPMSNIGGTFQVTQTAPVVLGTKTVTLDTPGYLRATVQLATVSYSLRFTRLLDNTTCSANAVVSDLRGVGRYDFVTDPSAPNSLRITTPGSVVLSSPSTFLSGCGVLPGNLATQAANVVHQQAEMGFKRALAEYNGNPPIEAPVALALRQTLGGLSFGGAITGAASGITLDAPLSAPIQDGGGIGASYDATVTIAPSTSAPLPGSLGIGDGTAPPPPATTPDGTPYDISIGASVSTINQLLTATSTRGAYAASVSTMGSQPLTYNLLRQTVPLGPPLDADRPVVLHVQPELAPAMTAAAPSTGSIGTIHVGGFAIDVRFADNDEAVVKLVTDFDASAHLTVEAGVVQLSIAAPSPDQVQITITDNPHHVDTASAAALVAATGTDLFRSLTIPTALPVPPSGGHPLHHVDSARIGDACYLFASFD